jgi:CheY-like chemotaxis protein
MNGLELLDAMRARDDIRHIPVLILTNFDDPESEGTQPRARRTPIP